MQQRKRGRDKGPYRYFSPTPIPEYAYEYPPPQRKSWLCVCAHQRAWAEAGQQTVLVHSDDKNHVDRGGTFTYAMSRIVNRAGQLRNTDIRLWLCFSEMKRRYGFESTK